VGGGCATYLLLEHIRAIAVLVALSTLDLFLQSLDRSLLLFNLLVVRGFLLEEPVDGARGDGEGCWRGHGVLISRDLVMERVWFESGREGVASLDISRKTRGNRQREKACREEIRCLLFGSRQGEQMRSWLDVGFMSMAGQPRHLLHRVHDKGYTSQAGDSTNFINHFVNSKVQLIIH
jgi:hypothetical protein